MAVDFPPGFPFHRGPSVAGPRPMTPEMVLASTSAEVAPPGPEGRAAAVVAFAQVRPIAVSAVGEAPAAPAAPLVERRRSPRQTLVAKASVRPDGNVLVPALVQSGFVSNISMSGVGFHTRKPLEVGGTYRITLELGPLKWNSRFKVITCRHHEESETFDVGGQFIGNELSRLPMAA